jgi:hypothetical protein
VSRIDGGLVVLMRPLIRDLILFVAGGVASWAVTASAIQQLRSPSRGLPYNDHFASGDNSEWVAYDGNWNVLSGVMVNESNERGAKLVTGSPYWTNYAVDADISVSSIGEAGIIARVSDPEPGVDSYHGLYSGLRVRDESLVFGVADHDWSQENVLPLPYPIVPNVWYHIRMELRDCHVSIFAHQEGKSQVIGLDEHLDQCPQRGKIGLRSYDSGGQWKNIRVTMLEK